MNQCQSCGSAHLPPVPCGLSFRERLLTVRMDSSVAVTRPIIDTDSLDEQFGTDRKERMLDDTHGFGAGRTGKDGRTYHRDRKTGDWQPMSDAEVESTYLSGTVVDES